MRSAPGPAHEEEYPNLCAFRGERRQGRLDSSVIRGDMDMRPRA